MCWCWTNPPTTWTPTRWRRWRICWTSWPGTLLVVSHDRYLIERVADTIVALFGDGRITHLPGGVDEYLRRRAADQQAAAAVAPVRAAAVAGPATTPVEQAGSVLDPLQQRALRKDLQRLERRMESLQRKEKDLHAKLAAAGADYAAAAEMSAALKALSVEVAEVETDWMAVAENLENG